MAWRDFIAPGRRLPDEPGEGDVFFGVGPITPADERRPGDPRPCRCGSAQVVTVEPFWHSRTGTQGVQKTVRRVPGTRGRSYVQSGSRQYCELCGVYGGDPDIEAIRSDPHARVYEEKIRGERS